MRTNKLPDKIKLRFSAHDEDSKIEVVADDIGRKPLLDLTLKVNNIPFLHTYETDIP
jgi:hypothetical protein